MGRLTRTAGVVAGVGVTGLAYARVEARAFRLRRVTVPVLRPGASPLRVLHISDLHLTPRQRLTRAWVRQLGELEPDLVVNTGDNLAHRRAVPAVLDALGPLLTRPGAFVLGSNDYYAPRPKNPARYLRRDDGRRIHGDELPWRDLRAGFLEHGWADLTNASAVMAVAGASVALRGVDDPHLWADRYGEVAGPVDPAAVLTIGVTHSPEPRVLDAMAADDVPLVLAGHTHGGQLCIPGFGALVTNCGLPRRQASGLSRWDNGWLHVSAGLGTSPYTPVRFACPPEATLLTLVAADAPSSARSGAAAEVR
jgi:predicted MPP superfamily phosphohydrolase